MMNAMQELESVLTKEEIEFLLNETLHDDYKNMIIHSKYSLADTLDLEELLAEYIQLKGMADDDLNENGIKVENILNKLNKYL